MASTRAQAIWDFMAHLMLLLLDLSEKSKEEEKKKQQARQTYVKRVIAHPSFHNVDFKTSEKLLAAMEQGDVVIRPSSKVKFATPSPYVINEQ